MHIALCLSSARAALDSHATICQHCMCKGEVLGTQVLEALLDSLS